MEAASSRFLRSSVRSTTSPSICSRAPINLTDCILSDGSDIKQNKTKPQTNKQKESTILSQGNVCSGLSSLARFCYSFVQGHSEPSHQVQGGGVDSTDTVQVYQGVEYTHNLTHFILCTMIYLAKIKTKTKENFGKICYIIQ